MKYCLLVCISHILAVLSLLPHFFQTLINMVYMIIYYVKVIYKCIHDMSIYVYVCIYIYIYIPVCTAQGGGGSFKDRKPIGEVRCCESWMGRANPLMDRKVVGGNAVEL